MPALKDRARINTVATLECAATRRYAEALLLQPDEPLGAVYLFGYTCEMRLKVAYYRLVGVADNQDLSLAVLPASQSPRANAEQRMKLMFLHSYGTPITGQPGHHLQGWALLVEDARAASALGAFDPVFTQDFFTQILRIWPHWAEFLRYYPRKPYNQELQDVAAVARWFKRHARQLWS